MSATNRGAERLIDDAYETPEWCVRRLLEDIDFQKTITGPLQAPLRAMDPCAGSGAIVRACVSYSQWTAGWDWVLYEKRREEKKHLLKLKKFVRAEVHIQDFLRSSPRVVQDRVDLVITNPPYSLAQDFILCAMSCATRAVAMLLRLNYLASETRSGFMRAHPPDVYVLPNRPSFTGGGTDATEYAWFVWPVPPDGLVRAGGDIKVLQSTSRAERSR